MLNLCVAYLATKINDGLLWCSPKLLLAFATELDMLASLASFMVAITGACISPCSHPCGLTHLLYCRLIGSEGFRQRLLRHRGKLVLLTPPRAGAAVQEVADHLKPMLTAAAGGSLDAYRI